MEEHLTWDDTYAIAKALMRKYPGIPLENVSLVMIKQWTLDLVDFNDDSNIANDEILIAIYLEWFEEVNPV